MILLFSIVEKYFFKPLASFNRKPAIIGLYSSGINFSDYLPSNFYFVCQSSIHSKAIQTRGSLLHLYSCIAFVKPATILLLLSLVLWLSFNFFLLCPIYCLIPPIGGKFQLSSRHFFQVVLFVAFILTVHMHLYMDLF